MRASLPTSRILYSCSMAMTCCSSVAQIANGTPRRSAVDETNQRALPANQKVDEPNPATADALEEIQPRVVGGTMSFRAAMRSARVSSLGSYSESVEISDSSVLY